MSKASPYPQRGSRPSDQNTRTLKADPASAQTDDKKASKVNSYEVDEHPFELRHEVKRLNTRLDKIADTLEKSDFMDMLQNYTSPKKRIISNLTAGIARGLGLSLGTVVILALLVWILTLLVNLNLPIVGEYIANLLDLIQSSRSTS
ncbi:DUF5665 domain-containing protein [Paenibacillus sp. JX-17]|uniref:DUF5665 domain-containing protein n=1 Tax=Paenibacillus lacisoli TaxID=3064525 RepID=A0ABT9CEX7_9BACL|nr:DUF5665 domain-containing protein [Paenibacillus sp. JX-17]MDO7907832.1 DUF5665 domain-containing protein [Paenibacillus sp. JX-17]